MNILISTLRIRIKGFLSKYIQPNGKIDFINKCEKSGKILDVGCGNNSPFVIKSLRPDIYYVGIDIGVYNQIESFSKYADEFILVKPENIKADIEKFSNYFDAVISSHNLEHCDNYVGVIKAMLKSLKKNGKIFISFPCEESKNFPSRKKTLNFFDDKTHKNLINYDDFIKLLNDNNVDILFTCKRYRPLIPFIIGLFAEPFCRLFNTIAPAGATWALYGFESITIAKKK